MNESNPPPVIPPTLPPGRRTLGDDPREREPITGTLAALEAVLRQPRRVVFQLSQPNPGPLIARLAVIAVVFALLYGVVIGTFSYGEQLWAAPLKVTVGLLLSALICLPSLYIFACLGGSRATLGEVIGLTAGLLTIMTLLLMGFAPVAWLFSQSTESVAAMGALHLLIALVALRFGWRFLDSGFELLGRASAGGVQVWIVIFALVLLQMTTALRPIIGTSENFLPTEKQFFLSHWADCLDSRFRGGR